LVFDIRGVDDVKLGRISLRAKLLNIIWEKIIGKISHVNIKLYPKLWMGFLGFRTTTQLGKKEG
jgi:hypothetical protein